MKKKAGVFLSFAFNSIRYLPVAKVPKDGSLLSQE
jgi:hypothetical protein